MNTKIVFSLKKHYFAAICWYGLMILTILWDGVFSPLNTSWIWLMVKLLPLCLPIRGISSGRIYTYQYCSMLILLPFTESVMRLWDKITWSVYFAAGQMILCVCFFVLCLIYLKQFKIKKHKQAA